MTPPRPTACPTCQRQAEWQMGGHISAHDLGRPRGAKGQDEAGSWVCPTHGPVTPVPDPPAQAAWVALAERLTALGFRDLWDKPLKPYSGLSVLVRGHYELLDEDKETAR